MTHAQTTPRRRLLPFLLLLVVLALVAAACGDDSDSSSTSSDSKATTSSSEESSSDDADATTESEAGTVSAGGGAVPSDDEVEARADKYSESPGTKLDPDTKYVVRVETTEGSFDITIDQKAGPLAAANFVGLVKDGFYDGIKFHRVIKGFMVQTGDPTGTGMGGPGYTIKDDDVTGDYSPGTVAMANAGPDTGGSQFFVVQGTDVQLGPDYAIFGKVDAAGLKTIDKIANVEVSGAENSTPVDTVQIVSAKLVEGA